MEIITQILHQPAEALPYGGYFSEASKDALMLLIGVVAAYSLRVITHLIFHNALIKR